MLRSQWATIALGLALAAIGMAAWYLAPPSVDCHPEPPEHPWLASLGIVLTTAGLVAAFGVWRWRPARPPWISRKWWWLGAILGALALWASTWLVFVGVIAAWAGAWLHVLFTLGTARLAVLGLRHPILGLPLAAPAVVCVAVLIGLVVSVADGHIQFCPA